MARKFIEGFEGNSLDGLTVFTGSPSVVANTGLGLSGSYCLSMPSGAGVTRLLPGTMTALYLALKFRYTSATGRTLIGFKDSAGAATLTIIRNSTSSQLEIRLGNGNGTTLLETCDTVLEINHTYLLEVYYVPLNSGGTITVKIDGTQDGTFSGDTTAGLENVLSLGFGLYIASAIAMAGYIDDIVVDDADWVGDTKILGQSVKATLGAGSTTQLTASTGDNFDCVNEIPYNDIDFVYGNSNNLIDTYLINDLSEAVSGIKCIQVSARMAYAGTPTPTQQDIIIRPASTDRLSGNPITPGIAFARYDRIWELNPEDSAAFEADDLNGMEIGVKLVA